MKKLSLALVTTLSLSTAVFAAENPTPGSNGQIKFTGTVTEAGCTITAGNSAIINLGSMPIAALKEKSSGWGEGQIKFENCNLSEDGKTLVDKKIQKVSITIQPGAKASFGTDLWANSGTAKGVGVEVEIGGDAGLKKVSPTGEKTPIEASINTLNDTAIYNVRGRMTGDATVTAGSVETTISFVANYK